MTNHIIPLTKKIAEIAHIKGIHHVVLSTGSRSAPLTIAFARHPEIKTYIIPDERSAGYIALGMSIILQGPVGVVCTSGTAALNLYPSVAEAYYQQTSLVIFTADRPPEWIDQADGQTIHQINLFGKHVKKFFNFPSYQDFDALHWHAERTINEAINYACEDPPGPVHINVPTREPFYPDPAEEYAYNTDPKIIDNYASKSSVDDDTWVLLRRAWAKADNILLVGGQGRYNAHLIRSLNKFSEDLQLPIMGDAIANIHSLRKNVITHHDLILSRQERSDAPPAPDLLITFGQALVSKKLKLFLRKHPPASHWHIQKAGYIPDTFMSLTTMIRMRPEDFFNQAGRKFKEQHKTNVYLSKWKKAENEVSGIIQKFFPQSAFSELEAVYQIIYYLPDHINLHLANSMPVRLVNLIGMLKPGIEVFSNRGVCGIDGCTSTALGISILSDKLNVLLTGDMAFFYDRNALWHKHIPENLRIIVLNNHGGGIFRLIEGPPELPELNEYFVTNQRLTARNTADDFNMDYFFCKDPETLNQGLRKFLFKRGRAKILEIETDSQINTTIFDSYISQFK